MWKVTINVTSTYHAGPPPKKGRFLGILSSVGSRKSCPLFPISLAVIGTTPSKYSTYLTQFFRRTNPASSCTKSVTPNMVPVRSTEMLEHLTLILLTWRIWWAPNNASRW